MTDEVPNCLTSARLSSVRSYLKRSNSDETRPWTFKLRRKPDEAEILSTERISLFPGWATRRREDASSDAFGIDVHVSGFASSHRRPDQLSRGQRVFIRIAKSFASLPKAASDAAAPDAEALSDLSLSPPLAEIPEEKAMKTLEREFQRANADNDDRDICCEPTPVLAYYPESLARGNENINGQPPQLSAQAAADISRQHATLEQRLQLFWASTIPGRTVRLQLFTSSSDITSTSSSLFSKAKHVLNPTHGPIQSQDVVTAPDGSFQVVLKVSWEDLNQHLGARHVALGGWEVEHQLHLSAQLLPPTLSDSSLSPSASPVHSQTPSYSPVLSTLQVPLSHSPVRVISDIDDTVKLSEILLGARAVFRNMFVKDLRKSTIPEMSRWFTGMWTRGVRFHYVSNSPFQILPVITEFLQISELPPGSVKLKSYAGGSFFSGVLSAQGARKRPGVIEILDAFPGSRFLLIGDSGQQDLELYADLARERPDQIRAVLIRYADNSNDPIEDTTGDRVMNAAGSRSSPLLPGPSGSADSDRPRQGRTLSDLLSRSPSSAASKSPVLKSSLTLPSPNEAMNGRADYIPTKQLTSEPESDTSPTPPLSASLPQSPILNPRSNSKVQVRTESLAPSPKHSPTVQSPGDSPRPASSSTFALPPLSRSLSTSSVLRLASLSDPAKKRNALQARVHRARKRIPRHIPLRVFSDPSECIEVDEVLKEMGM